MGTPWRAATWNQAGAALPRVEMSRATGGAQSRGADMLATETESLTLELPIAALERIRESARRSHRPVEREAEALLQHALSAPDRLRRAMEQSHREYQDYLKQTGQEPPTDDELNDRMREIREEVANELYPGSSGRS
jgi:hypothetical protein